MLTLRVHRALLAVAVSVFLFAPTARAQDDLAPSPDAPASQDSSEQPDAMYPEAAPAEPAPPPPADDRLPRLKVHAAGFGYHGVLFRTQVGDAYGIHGPAVAYDYFVGRRFGFALHGAAFMPAFGHYSGQDNWRGPLWGKYADRHSGFDATFMVAYRIALGETFTLFLGAGLHAQTFTINGAEYRPIETITMGLGMVSRLQWNFHPLLTLNGDFLLALDPFDMIAHDNPAMITVPVGLTLGIGVRY